MLVTKEIVKLKRGLQARNTSIFVYKAMSFSSEVFITKNGETSNGKEIMKVMDLNVKNGDEITLLVNGVDEQLALHSIKNFLLSEEA